MTGGTGREPGARDPVGSHGDRCHDCRDQPAVEVREEDGSRCGGEHHDRPPGRRVHASPQGEQEQRQPLYLRDVRMVSRLRDVKR
jgi:hypothetical protein